jgi:hypothetical protein
MKHKITALVAMLFSGAFLFAQMPGGMTMQASAPQGTTLGANTTSGSAGIALGNRVVMRGYVDFVYSSESLSDDISNDKKFNTNSDIDFLFDFSPVTAEVHIAMTPSPDKTMNEDEVEIEQAFGRYAFNRDFNITFGRQVTALGFDGDEATDLYTVSNSYFAWDLFTNEHMLSEGYTSYLNEGNPHLIRASDGTKINDGDEFATVWNSSKPRNIRKNYADGIRANFNNGRFGLSLGLHDSYWVGDDLNDNIAIDIVASLMIIPGLETRVGYAHQDLEEDDISQFNTWLAYKPGDLTLATEFDYFELGEQELWDLMFLANYQFSNWFGMTARYSHEDWENILPGYNLESDRITLAFLFSVTEKFAVNLEYSHTEYEFGDDEDSADEFYVEGLLTF